MLYIYISLNSMNRLVFVIETQCIYVEVGNGVLKYPGERHASRM